MIRLARALAPSLLAAVLVAGCASSTPDTNSTTSALTAPVSVFADALATGWQDWSWATVNMANSTPVASGSRSIAVTYGAWQGLYFHSAGTALTGLSTIDFDVNGGATSNPSLAVYTTVAGAQQTQVALNGYCKGGTIPANAFTHCSIPLTALGISGATIDGIVIRESAGKALPVLYVDTVTVAPPPVPAAPTGLVAAVTPSDVTLKWNGVSGATGYKVYRAIGTGSAALLASPTAATYRDLAVTNGTSYKYSVSAVGAGGEGARSAAVAAAVPAATFVYRDAMAGPWTDASWSTHNLAATSPVAIGTRSISSSFGAWSGLYFKHPGLDTTGLTSVTLRVNGGTTAGPALHIRTVVNGTPTAGTDLGPNCTGGTIPANAWTLCTVPMPSIAPAGATITGIEIQEWKGGTIPTMYFDEVGVLGTVQPVTVAVNPTSTSIATGTTATFTATVGGSSNTAVTWSVQEGAAGGTVTAAGVYTAPTTAGTYHVVATSVAAPTVSATATVTVTAGVTVAVNPTSASIDTSGTATFTATVASSSNTAVTWSVKEGAAGGTITAAGVYTAPATAGTYHVVATSVAAPAVSATATVTVTAPAPVSVTVNPAGTSMNTGTTFSFTATVTGTANTAVTWSVQEGAAGGTITAAGLYTAPGAAGTFHVIATSVASPAAKGTASVTVSVPPSSGGLPGSDILPADRVTLWNPGVPGGIPARSTICATVQASSCGANGTTDATSCIQAAINSCPAGQVVSLSAGTFLINSGNYLLINKGITLRGAGPTKTILSKTNGATQNSASTGPSASPLIIVGPGRWSSINDQNWVASSINLTADAAKEATSVTVASTTGLKVGGHVLLDELSGASWQTDPQGRGQIWMAADGRVVYQLHNPAQPNDDPLVATTPTSGGAASWFSRQDRPTNEIKEIASISGNTVTFTSPIHISYRVSHTAQLGVFGVDFVRNAGIEDLAVKGGDDGQFRFHWCDSCWATRIDNSMWLGEGFAIDHSMRVEVRDSYVHDGAWPEPGGGGYAISLARGSSDVLVENNIILKTNKNMVVRSCGAGSVFGYNYTDDAWVFTNSSWVEVGLNASHMVGSHHVLFEGNYGQNFDSDKTHGNAVYHTVFRNHLRGVRRDFNDTVASGNGPLRCGGLAAFAYWDSFVGNVLGAQGQMTGWVNEGDSIFNNDAIWKMGWDDWAPYPLDPQVAATVIRHGNFDYLSNAVGWDPKIAQHNLPDSLYLKGRPAFFDAGKGYTWPWVNPTSGTPLATLPAKARYDAGTPFTQP